MELSQMDTFLAVAAEGSFSRAGKRLSGPSRPYRLRSSAWKASWAKN